MEAQPVPGKSRMRSAMHTCGGWAPLLPPILLPRTEDAAPIAVTSNSVTVAVSPAADAEGTLNGVLAGCTAAE
ncbi:hypothetical protein [Propionivibrio dicarboxylicus]|uniref:Uncharacterized protein n=1 Tax=Propionivibrio dicarboxylicus TaxID=83767 RepID=A0A1G8AIJ4_9RHOO|nr:hypothetical protein [Propionivibrio dicarboxylicus]SDH20751.1 hypothetical protein SAMN05660652_01397 [Propionivibrio dicarboxylicus]